MDSDDIAEIFNSFMSSNIVKNLAEHIFRRSLGSEISYDNPYHPEDKFVTGEIAENRKQKTTFQSLSKDALDTENEKFADGHISEDILTDNGVDGSEVRQLYNNNKQNLIETRINNLKLNSENKNENQTMIYDTAKMSTKNYRAVLKPIIRRFIVKRRNANG
ncbi:unnamed protein product [Arctia plantaginis]|uniref:Uncharacterized protein n=1 Tax=Arctia plantaginis TaxID=874455 RepID=A0A8S0ZRL8_ARCPL|nr:unnamed protein product [Arctia plantaginis]CAB3250764.1 unnamed protein product [Arctia plantaginis]